MQMGSTYTFANGHFTLTQQLGGGSAYVIANGTPTGLYSFGLAQQAVINNAPTVAPLTAMPALYNQSAWFYPTPEISIFLSSCHAAGTVIPAPANALALALGPQASSATVGFNDSTDLFFQIS